MVSTILLLQNLATKFFTFKISRVTNAERERLKAQRERYRQNPKRFIAAQVRWRKKHPDKFRAYQRAWKKKNRKRLTEASRAYRRAYYLANAEKLKTGSLAYNRAHAEQVAQTKRKWYYANVERERANSRARMRRLNRSRNRALEALPIEDSSDRFLSMNPPH
jgi:hypothetical protein